MLFEEANQLSESRYLPVETGYYRLLNGHMHLAVLTRMPHCKGKMVDWWFGTLDGTEKYKMWEPKSHLALEWDENWKPERYIGASCVAEKKLGERIIKLRIHFHESSEFLGTSMFEEAGISTFICANAYDFDKVPKGRIIHFIRDTSYGCEMRSRFWLFKASEAECMDLMQHCIEEMGNLADFLPDLYAREKGALVDNHPGSRKPKSETDQGPNTSQSRRADVMLG